MSSIVIGLSEDEAGGGGMMEGTVILGTCLTRGPVELAEDIIFSIIKNKKEMIIKK